MLQENLKVNLQVAINDFEMSRMVYGFRSAMIQTVAASARSLCLCLSTFGETASLLTINPLRDTERKRLLIVELLPLLAVLIKPEMEAC